MGTMVTLCYEKKNFLSTLIIPIPIIPVSFLQHCCQKATHLLIYLIPGKQRLIEGEPRRNPGRTGRFAPIALPCYPDQGAAFKPRQRHVRHPREPSLSASISPARAQYVRPPAELFPNSLPYCASYLITPLRCAALRGYSVTTMTGIVTI